MIPGDYAFDGHFPKRGPRGYKTELQLDTKND